MKCINFTEFFIFSGKKSPPPRKDSISCCSHLNQTEIKEKIISDLDVIEDLSKTLEDSKIQDSKSKTSHSELKFRKKPIFLGQKHIL